jgi:zinc transport system permease protein
MIEFLAYPFFQRALVAGGLVALLCGALSFFVVLRRLAFVGSGVAHAAFGGVAIATLLGLPPGPGGAVAALLVAGATARASQSGRVTEDAAVGVFTVAAMAAGVVALGFVKTNVDLFGLMFGNILTVDPADLAVLAAATGVVLLLLAAFFRPLLLASVDEEGAGVAGVNVGRMRLLVLTLLAIAVVVALKVVGILLVSALLVLPGAVARPLSDRWPGFVLGSVSTALVMVLGGLFLSVALDIAPGASIILLGAALFVAALAVARAGTRGRRGEAA